MILSDPMLWRLVWKEYRAQRSFWLVIAGFGIGLMLVMMTLLDASTGRFTVPWVIALGLPAFYALGCGAVLFASEQEEGTTELLRIMATRTSRLFTAKVSFSLVSTAVLAGLLFAAARLLTWGHHPNFTYTGAETAFLSAWLTISLLVWGTFFSTVCRKVLAAVCLSAASPLIVRAVTQWLPWNNPGQEQGIWYLEMALPVPILCASYFLLQRTMAGCGRELSWPRLVWRRTAAGGTLDCLAAARDTAPPWRRLFMRLVWIEIRHALSLGHVLWIGGIALFFLAIAFPAGRFQLEQTIFGVFILPTLIGVWTFQADGGRRTHFLAEHGLSPIAVWLSKQLVWLGLTILASAPFVVVVEIVNRESVQGRMASSSMFHPDVPGASAVTFTFALACLGYSAGQFASMFIPRGVTAGFVGFAIYMLLVPWTWLMFALQVPLWLSVVPLVVFMLAATCTWSRHWLLEAATWRSWRRLGLSVGAALFLVWGSVGAFRVLEVPNVEGVVQNFAQGHPVFESNHFQWPIIAPMTSAEAETAQMYQRARSEYTWKGGRPWESDGSGMTARDGWASAREEERQLLADNQRALETTVAATARPSCAFTDPSRPPKNLLSNRGTNDFSELVNLILLSARQLESEEKLDDALERYLAALRVGRHLASRGPQQQWLAGASTERVVANWMPLWAAHPGQSAERIEAGARRVREELSQFPPLSEALQIERLWLRDVIDRDWSETFSELDQGGQRWDSLPLFLIDRCCPWERYRARRLLDLIYFADLGYIADIEHALSAPWGNAGSVLQAAANPVAGTNSFLSALGFEVHAADVPTKLARTTLPWSAFNLPTITVAGHVRLLRELPLRALLLRLELAAWKSAHGEYPARLDDLPDAGRAATIDPYTGNEFGYRPNGFPSKVRFINPATYLEEVVAAGQSLIWSAGPYNVRIVPFRHSPDVSPEFEGVISTVPIDARREKHIGAYVFMLP